MARDISVAMRKEEIALWIGEIRSELDALTQTDLKAAALHHLNLAKRRLCDTDLVAAQTHAFTGGSTSLGSRMMSTIYKHECRVYSAGPNVIVSSRSGKKAWRLRATLRLQQVSLEPVRVVMLIHRLKSSYTLGPFTDFLLGARDCGGE